MLSMVKGKGWLEVRSTRIKKLHIIRVDNYWILDSCFIFEQFSSSSCVEQSKKWSDLVWNYSLTFNIAVWSSYTLDCVILWTWSCQHRIKIVHVTEWVSSPLLAGASDWLAAWKCCGYVWSQSSWWRLQGIISSESFNISSIFINIFFRRNTETVLSDTDIVDAIQGKIRSNSKEKDGRARLLDLLKTEGTDMIKLDRSKMFWLT